jgi:aminopeptidase N
MKLLTLAFTLLMTISIFSQVPPIEPGVSQTLAKWRAANYSDVRYKLNITLEKGAPLMKGDIEIRVKLSEEGARNDLILDWRTTAFQNDKDKPYANVVAVNNWSASVSLANVAESGVETSDSRQSQNQTASSRSALKVSETLALQLNEHLIIPKNLLKTGENFIKIQFASPIKTSGAAITRYVDKEDGTEYVYSLFVPSDASTAFPVFDQPDLKARFRLGVNAPKEWKVVSNTDSFKFYVDSFNNRSKTINTTNNVKGEEWSFFETKPISTYVFAFAAGDFTEFQDSNPAKSDLAQPEILPLPDNPEELQKTLEQMAQGRWKNQSNIYVRKSQAEKFKQHAAETFRLNREAVKFLESYFDFKFPFPKYDLVLIPEFPFGGMEHAGATFLRESSVIFPSEPTANDYISRANLIFHEAAHQWFGDTVTMKWFDDLWLKEGFAEFMAYKTLEKVLPEYNAWKAFYERNKPLAYQTDSTRGTTPIYQEIPNLSAAKSAYGNIVYRKAPSFLRQAEFYLGEDKFQTAVRAFLKKHQFANAEWTDLVKEFETASGRDLKDWANVWVMQKGVPIMRVDRIKYPKKSDSFYSLRQTNITNDIGFWKMKFNIFVKFKQFAPSIYDREFKDKNYVVLGGFTNDAEDFIFPNYQDYGYGIFLLDEKSRAYILENIQNEKDAFLRSMMWGTLWDSVREAELAPETYVQLAIKNISVEQDELTIQTILNRVSTAMNYYIETKSVPPASAGGLNANNSNAKRNPSANADGTDLSARLEHVLIEKMRNATTLGQRITFYRAFLNVSSSENARNILKDILSGKLQIQNLTLKTKDKFDIVTKLLILGDKDAPQLLAELEKTETSDEAKRYAYAAKAGIASAENKAKFWNDFVNNKEISESWIEAAFAPFNSPRHAELTLPYLEKALAELPNLKRNRKIFFVNGWLGAFIGGQKSEQALAVVNKFLADNPNLDRDLRLKILENVDALERAVKIRDKYGKN